MRVVSMVPSWTETLIEAGIEVVGRTRYCIHPADKVQNIPIVGGTKEIDWDSVIEISPDLILFDKEENLEEMAEQCEFPYYATHVTSLQSLQKEFENLGDLFKNHHFIEWSIELLDLLESPAPRIWSSGKIPAQLASLAPLPSTETPVVYVIWKKPWMAVSADTYIGSVLEYLGAKIFKFETEDKYPVFELTEAANAYFLFSSEPYPFAKKISELKELGVKGAVVNGESYSWYGIRGLKFLSDLKSQQNSQGKWEVQR